MTDKERARTLLDDLETHKDALPEGVYLNACNVARDLYEREESVDRLQSLLGFTTRIIATMASDLIECREQLSERASRKRVREPSEM